MFIKEVKKQNKGYDQVFSYHRLMESYRTERGPRQRTLLNLGKLDLPKAQWKLLADRIEELVTGQQSLLAVDEHIEQLATHYARLIIRKQLTVAGHHDQPADPPPYETIAIDSISNSNSRTIGAEYVGLSMYRQLGLDSLFQRLGFSEREQQLAALSIVARLVHPSSERDTRQWAQQLSGLDELLDTDFTQLSNNALYRSLDLLLSHKEAIEAHLKLTEHTLFSLQEQIILYDLTNTYFEGDAKGNDKAKRGRSKDKRHDRPLVTLGLVIDGLGFPKTSKIFKGNVPEGKTLLDMLTVLQGKSINPIARSETTPGTAAAKQHVTVVLDAGIAIEDNIKLLKREGYDYIVVARNKPLDRSELDGDDWLTIKHDNKNKVEAKLIKQDDEHILYCKSYLKQQKEQAMKTQFQQRFEQALSHIAASLTKKGGTKKYDKVLQRIGRQQEKYAAIAHYYKVAVNQQEGIATAVNWKFDKQQQADQRFSGSYFLRTSRLDLSEAQIWSLYVMLTHLEDAFRCLKSDLILRPVHHQKEQRVDAHLFITVLAYHLLIGVQTQLRQHDVDMRWWQIRKLLSSHVRVTTSMTNKEGERIHVRNSTEPESFHRKIYQALGLKLKPLKQKLIKL
jgi:transposase